MPLVCDHDLGQQVDVVHELLRVPLHDGIWHVARCTVDAPPSWLGLGTPASFSFEELGSYDVNGWTSSIPYVLVGAWRCYRPEDVDAYLEARKVTTGP